MGQPCADDTARSSSVRRVGEAAPSTMSERLWAINWPSWTYEGISCAAVAFDDVVPFIGKHYPSIFATEPDRFFEEKMTPAKRRFLGECDAFLFRRGDVEAGIAIGHPTD